METYQQQIIGEIKSEFGIDLTEVIQRGIVDVYEAKKWLVLQQYHLMAKQNKTYTAIKQELSARYNISVSSIEKMVYRKN